MNDFDPNATCHDCGDAPQWPWARRLGGCEVYCKRCNDKAGYRTTCDVDPDLLVAYFEGSGGEIFVPDATEAAKTLLEACSPRSRP